MENSEESKKINVRDWIILSTTMIGAVLTILALIWQVSPTSGIVSATFLLMLSFVLFVNSVSANSKAYFEAKSGKIPETRINSFVTFAEYSFGLGFTLVITGFAILGYKYLMDFTGGALIALILPVAFLITAWIMILIYNAISYAGKILSWFRSAKRILWVVLEIVCLAIIFLDFMGIILIP